MIGPDALAGFGIAIGAVFTGWQSWQARKQATQAAANAKPVSNGFSAKVLEDLSYVRDQMDALRTDVAHVNDRQTKADDRMNALSLLLSSHLQDHSRAA